MAATTFLLAFPPDPRISNGAIGFAWWYASTMTMREVHSAIVVDLGSIQVRDYQCNGSDVGGPQSIEAPYSSIVFPRHGLFAKHVEGKSTIADAKHAIGFVKGECYRLSHPLFLWRCDHGARALRAPLARDPGVARSRGHEPLGKERADF